MTGPTRQKVPQRSLLSRLSNSILLPLLFLVLVVFPPIVTFDPLHRRISQVTELLPFTVTSTPTYVPPSHNLSTSPIYSEHYNCPSHGPLREIFLSFLDGAIRSASTDPVRFDPIEIKHGHTIEGMLRQHGYVHSDKPVNQLCFPASNGRKPLCLSSLQNSVYTTSGVAICLNSSTVYELAGGCCDRDWKLFLNKTVTFPPRTFDTVAKYSGKAVLVLNQHHGSTFHHVIHEIVSRYLLALPILDANPEILVSVDHSDMAGTILSILGLAPERLIEFPSLDYALWTFGSLLLFPPPVYQHDHLGHFPKNQTIITSRILRSIVERDNPLPVSNTSMPVLLLMERALSREIDGRCHESRCVKNFVDLENAIREKFEDRMTIIIFKANEDLRTSIGLFSAASVVVGVHGAGFQNVMFCKPGITVVHIGWDMHYKYLVEQFDLNFHQVDVPTMRRNHKNIVLDVKHVMEGVSQAIQDDKVVNETVV